MRNKGFTFIEIIIAIAVFIIFALGVYQGFTAVYAAIAAAHHKALAADLVNARFEILKNLPYSDVGTVGGDPVGVVDPDETAVSDGLTFTLATTIENVDDTFDGISGGGDAFPDDYKLVEIEVDCTSCKNFTPITITGRIAPANLENS